jgi:magnesium-transporting ATPase (P-type)
MDSSSKQPFYRLAPADVLAALGSRAEGLKGDEVTARQGEHGPNRLAITHKESPLITYARQFKDLMILLLMASSFISYWLGDPQTAAVLFLLVIFNTTVGFFAVF